MGIPFRQRVQHRRVLPHDHKLTDLARRQDKHKQKNSKRDIVVVNGGQHDVNTSVAESLVSPDCFDIFDDLLLFSVFRHTTVFREKGYGYGRAEHVKVMILSTLLSRESCQFPCEDFENSVDDKLQKSVFVGQVTHASEESSLSKGMLVTSFLKCPVHTQFLDLPVDALIPVPDRVDTGEAAAVVSSFVPAMGMLFHGRDDRSNRFADTSLKGLDILVTGGGTDKADAVVTLALLGGANRVFVLQSKLSMATSHAHSVRVELVSDNPDEWRPFIDRFMDLIVDFEYPRNFDALYGILKSTGRLVCRKAETTGILAPLNVFWDELRLLSYPNACLYDIEEQIENEHADMVRDVRYLFRMLEKRRIRPFIEQYVMVRDIDSIREQMRHKPGSGAVICEPWRQYLTS